jgi:hypothetical protein
MARVRKVVYRPRERMEEVKLLGGAEKARARKLEESLL